MSKKISNNIFELLTNFEWNAPAGGVTNQVEILREIFSHPKAHIEGVSRRVSQLFCSNASLMSYNSNL